MRNKLALAAILSLCSFSAMAGEPDAPAFATDTLTGDWGGSRTKLYNQGVDVEVTYKGDVWRNLKGGIKKGNAYNDNLDVKLTLDGEKLLGLKGSKAFIYAINNNGGNPNGNYVGSLGGIDNIETDPSTAKLYEAWVEQNLFGDALSVKAGLYDLNSEFYVTDASGLFLNSTYGIGTEFAASGNNGPSIFPTTSLALRVKVQPTKETYAQFAVLDGVPGDVSNPKGHHIDLDDKDAALLVGEAGYADETIGHYAIGAWHYTGNFDEWGTGSPLPRDHNSGYYFLAEKTLFKGKNDSKVDGFFRLGFANESVSTFDYSWATGFTYQGICSSRKDGTLGLAISGAEISDDLKRVSPMDSRETQIELTYEDKLTPWLTVQPDFQYTVNPGADPSLSNAYTAGVRFTVNF